MYEIKAVIQPFMLTHVIEALQKIPDMPGVTISEVKGFGRSRANVPHSTVEWGVTVVPKLKLETVVSDSMLDTVVETIQRHAHTGNVGDGKIFVYEVKRIVKIRTNETGEAAL